MKFQKLLSMAALCFVLVITTAACQERPATPYPTANPSQDDDINQLYKKAHDPWEAESVLSRFGLKTIEAQKIILTYYVDGYLQQSGFGLDRMRMELLKGLISFYYYDFNPAEILNVTRELPKGGSTGFAFLSPRTIVIIARELDTLWQNETLDTFPHAASDFFLDMGTDSSLLSAFVRALEINNYFVRLENKEAITGESLSIEYRNPEFGISMEYPDGWSVAEFEQGISIYSPGSSVSITILQPEDTPVVNELINVFRQEAQQSNPSLKFEEGVYSEIFESVDDQASITFRYHLDYPSGQENAFVVNVIALQQNGTDWILIGAYEDIEEDLKKTLETIVETVRLGE